ncbi:MAG TPA: hypothetical protein VF609_15875, partial [Flavisolibacter sp.]
MPKHLVAIFFIFISFSLFGQSKTSRWFVNAGAGPSYSLFYKNGGWVRDFGVTNTANITESREAWAFSHFAEVERRFKNNRLSARIGYSIHFFEPRFQKNYTTANGTVFLIDTRERDRYLYLQPTIHYAFLVGQNRLEAGTGFYIQKGRRQTISYYNQIVVNNQPSAPTLFIEDHTSEEAGFPFNIDYVRTFKNQNGIGCRLNFNYTQSLQT